MSPLSTRQLQTFQSSDCFDRRRRAAATAAAAATACEPRAPSRHASLSPATAAHRAAGGGEGHGSSRLDRTTATRRLHPTRHDIVTLQSTEGGS